MRIAISGTYSTGKTTTSVALAHLTSITHTRARTMRELLPEVLPGRSPEECTGPELVQLGMTRFAERAVHESHLPTGFISDGSSLHEWAYGKIRTLAGIHPTDDSELIPEAVAAAGSFAQIIDAIGAVAKRHAQRAYDVFVHLPIEFDLVADGHRPVSERFRTMTDHLLMEAVAELRIPHHIIGGTLSERLTSIVDVLGLRTTTTVDEAIERARVELTAASRVGSRP